MPEEGVPTPEKKSHTGLIVAIVLIVIVVLLALFFGLYFGLRNKGGDIPDEVNPDPDIVEPGPADQPKDGGIIEPYEVVWLDTPSLPETIEKDESIEDLDKYVEVHFDHADYDIYEDDTYTLTFEGSEGVEIDGTTATFIGDGGSTQYITAVVTPDNDPVNSLSQQSEGIIITHAFVDAIGINFYDYVLNIPKNDASFTLEVITSPEDAWPIPEVTWTVTGDTEQYIDITPYSSGAKCTVSTSDIANALPEGTYIDGFIVTATIGDETITTFSCSIAISTYDFATNSWELIEKTAAAGEASTYYSIGDTRTIAVGDDENKEYHDIRIIGFDHDELTTPNDYSGYNNDSGKAGITCEMVDCLDTARAMNSSETNVGGWAESEMRTYLNTSTEDELSVLSTLDEDLQAIIKKVDKKSTAGGGTTSKKVESTTTSSDSLFLLAYGETIVATGKGYEDEGTQYEYYEGRSTSTDDRIKYRNGEASYWWFRSPRTNSNTIFYGVGPSGRYSNNNAANSELGVSFAFCI